MVFFLFTIIFSGTVRNPPPTRAPLLEAAGTSAAYSDAPQRAPRHGTTTRTIGANYPTHDPNLKPVLECFAGDTLEILDGPTQGYYYARSKDNRRGYFPASCLVLEALPAAPAGNPGDQGLTGTGVCVTFFLLLHLYCYSSCAACHCIFLCSACNEFYTS